MKETKLHIGCGKRYFGCDWIHIDGGDFPHLEYKDVTNLSQFKNNTVDVIYSCHLLEYFDREEVVMVLNEWKRVLKPGGTLRLAVPDFNMLAAMVLCNGHDMEYILGPLYGKWDMNGKAVYHKTCYNFKSLKKLLNEVGFKDIVHYDWRKTEHAEFDDHSQSYMNPKGDKENGTLISLNVECVKQ